MPRKKDEFQVIVPVMLRVMAKSEEEASKIGTLFVECRFQSESENIRYAGIEIGNIEINNMTNDEFFSD